MPAFTRDYESFVTGEIAGSTSAAVNPTIPCRMANFKAAPDNAGKVYIGISGVTKADGSVDATTGWVLSPGEETGFWPLGNVNQTYRICDNATDDILYVAFS